MHALARILAFAIAAACGSAQAEDDIDAKPALAAADAFLAALDAGRYGASWEDAAAMFREATSKVQWEASMQGVRAPLGVVISRKVRLANFSRGIASDLDAAVLVIQYDTRFENRPLSTEIVTPLRGKDGAWKVSAYILR